MTRCRTSRACLAIMALSWLALTTGCWSSSGRDVVVYTALDREFSEPVFKEFTAKTGIRVRAAFDAESFKTVGLANRILAESARPRCDLFWNNEILNTLRLEQRGLLQVYRSPAAADYSPEFQSSRGTWYGFAARARILIVNTERLDSSHWPTSIYDLVDPTWKGRAGIAKPLFGTTATHAAVLFAAWGEPEAHEYFRRLRDNAQVLSGNRQVAQAVARGQLDFGLTDTDDAMVELEKGSPVKIVYPDQQEGELGTLFIPNTLALIKDGPHGEAARELLDYLLSPEVETFLAESSSAQIPLNRRVTVKARVETPATVRAMAVDFDAAAEQWDNVSEFLRKQFVSVSEPN